MAGEIGILKLELSGEQLDELADRIVDRLGSAKPQAPKLLLDTIEICAAMGIGRPKLDQLVKLGLPQRRLGPGTVRYKLADCEKWLDEHPHVLADRDSD